MQTRNKDAGTIQADIDLLQRQQRAQSSLFLKPPPLYGTRTQNSACSPVLELCLAFHFPINRPAHLHPCMNAHTIRQLRFQRCSCRVLPFDERIDFPADGNDWGILTRAGIGESINFPCIHLHMGGNAVPIDDLACSISIAFGTDIFLAIKIPIIPPESLPSRSGNITVG